MAGGRRSSSSATTTLVAQGDAARFSPEWIELILAGRPADPVPPVGPRGRRALRQPEHAADAQPVRRRGRDGAGARLAAPGRPATRRRSGSSRRSLDAGAGGADRGRHAGQGGFRRRTGRAGRAGEAGRGARRRPTRSSTSRSASVKRAIMLQEPGRWISTRCCWSTCRSRKAPSGRTRRGTAWATWPCPAARLLMLEGLSPGRQAHAAHAAGAAARLVLAARPVLGRAEGRCSASSRTTRSRFTSTRSTSTAPAWCS